MVDHDVTQPAGAELDTLIAQARAGAIDTPQLVWGFLNSTVVVPSGESLDSGRGAMTPVLIERDGVTLMVVFSNLDHARSVGHLAPYAATLTGQQVIAGLAEGNGVVVNPDGAGFEIDPELVRTIKAANA